jgi:integrase
MTGFELPYVQRVVDRFGKVRFYFRRDGYARCRLPGEPLGPEFMTAYHEALAAGPLPLQGGQSAAVAGSIGWLVEQYYRGAAFRGLKPGSQTAYRGILEQLRETHGHRLVKHLQRKNVRALRDAKAATPDAANSLLKVLRHLIRLALDLELIATDPSRGIKRLKPANPDGYHTWTEPEIARYRERWPVGSEERMALELLLHTGQRRSDVIRLGPKDVTEDGDGARWIVLTQLKTGTPVHVPLHPELEALLRFDRPAFLLARRGQPCSPAVFSDWFRKACDAAGLPHCTAHGLRKAAARRLAEAGCTTHQIAAITGHKTLVEVERYARQYDRKRSAGDAMRKVHRHRADGEGNSF